jgi:hypothetical protein
MYFLFRPVHCELAPKCAGRLPEHRSARLEQQRGTQMQSNLPIMFAFVLQIVLSEENVNFLSHTPNLKKAKMPKYLHTLPVNPIFSCFCAAHSQHRSTGAANLR